MNRLIFKLMLLLSFTSSVIFSQSENAEGNYFNSGSENKDDVIKQGLNITSKGEIKALAIFIQFKDDTVNSHSAYWAPNKAPTFLNTYLDTSLNQTSTPWSFSDYYKQMSFNSLRMYGNGYFAITKHTEKYYRDTLAGGKKNTAFGFATREVLAALNSQINYADYDNWRFGINSHSKVPDGKVDLILVLYRTLTWPPNASGIAQLGNGSGVMDTILDGKKISFRFPGSGITNSGGNLGMRITLESMKHEFGHLLFGSGHPAYNGFTYNGGQTQFAGMWGIMPIVGYCANAFERERMGWIKPIVVTNNEVDSLTDFVTTGKALKIPIPGTNDSYYVENHMQLSMYDSDVDQVDGKGLMIYKVIGTAYHPTYDVETADGKFDWANPYWIPHPYGGKGELPVYQKLKADRNGYDFRDYIPHTRPKFTGGKYEIFVLDDDGLGGKPYTLFAGWKGNGHTAFNINYNRVFAPWTNPGSGNTKNISVYIKSNPGSYMEVETEVQDITIHQNTTLPAETFEFSGDFIVPSGVTLNLKQGTTLKFAEGKSLIVNGKLIRLSSE